MGSRPKAAKLFAGLPTALAVKPRATLSRLPGGGPGPSLTEFARRPVPAAQPAAPDGPRDLDRARAAGREAAQGPAPRRHRLRGARVIDPSRPAATAPCAAPAGLPGHAKGYMQPGALPGRHPTTGPPQPRNPHPAAG